MRISCSPDDPGYHPQFAMCRFWLAGAERNNVETADEAKRYAVTLARDEWGAPLLGKDGAQIRQKFYGDVRIDAPSWLRTASEEPQEEADTLSAAIWAMAQVP